MLEELLSGIEPATYDDRNALFIDRNPKNFNQILDFLRMVKDGKEQKVNLPFNAKFLEELYNEADYFKLHAFKCLINPFYESKILTFGKSMKLIETCSFKLDQKWRLVYTGSIHGFNSDAFYSRCDGLSKCLVLVKTDADYIFGGYTEECWERCNNIVKTDPSSFLISFATDDVQCMKIINKRTGNDLFCNSNSGPIFGFNQRNNQHDLFIANNANLNEKSYCKVAYSYFVPYTANKKSFFETQFLAGSYYFKLYEIEIFSKINLS